MLGLITNKVFEKIPLYYLAKCTDLDNAGNNWIMGVLGSEGEPAAIGTTQIIKFLEKSK